MSRLGLALALVALLLTAGAAVVGHRLGTPDPVDERDLRTEQQEAFLAAFSESSLAASTGKEDSGYRAGAAAGRNQGEKYGTRWGRTTGAEQAADAKLVTRPSKRESEPDLRNVSGDALVVGDSLEVLSSPYLEQYLPSVELTINVVGGYSSIQIFGLFQESFDASHEVVVFDAGTNDNPSYPSILAGNLQRVAQTVGDRCMVVPTIHGLTVNGVDSSAKNKVVRSFAASRPGTQVPDWAGAVADHPELMQPDNLHARLIARGIRGCLAYGASFGSGSP